MKSGPHESTTWTNAARARPLRLAEVPLTQGEQAFLRLPPDEMARRTRLGTELSARLAERVRIFLMLGRPRTCVPNLLAFGLGYGYTGGGFSLRMLVGALLSCCIGFSANVHNAAVELEEDSQNLPGRVLLVAKFGHPRLLRWWRVLVLGMMLAALAMGLYFSIFMALAIIGLHQYSAPPVRSKGRPILGLWVFAQTVVFPFLFGWTTEPGRLLENLIDAVVQPLRGLPPPEAEVSHLSFRYLAMWAFVTVWFMAKGAFKNVPDFGGDKAAGVRTSATLCRSQRSAAQFAALSTVLAYASLALLPAFGLESPRVLWALAWLVPVAINCARLVSAQSGAAANRVLKHDMWLSTGFLASLLLLVSPGLLGVTIVIAALGMLFGSDALGLDSRRPVDVRRAPVQQELSDVGVSDAASGG
jgi:4-hydroxybenzoate polyprenyltransferase